MGGWGDEAHSLESRCDMEKARDGQWPTFDFSQTQRLLLNLNCHLQLIVMDFPLARAPSVLISRYRQEKQTSH